jgi:DNA-binding transcriptional regulator LsrR (DeoR family)
MIEPEDFEAARRAGGIAEILGHIIGHDGRLVECAIAARTLSMPARDIGARDTIAIAGGRSKIEAIRAVLASGLITGLITDERTANALVA